MRSERKISLFIPFFIFCILALVFFIIYQSITESVKIEDSANEQAGMLEDDGVVDSKKDYSYSDIIEGFVDKKSLMVGEEIEWKAVVSPLHSQINGIKFCIIDNQHDFNEYEFRCDVFWAFSDDLIDADDLEKNPDWDGDWVKYTLEYYSVDYADHYPEKIYTVKGRVNGLDCGIDTFCIPDINIVDIAEFKNEIDVEGSVVICNNGDRYTGKEILDKGFNFRAIGGMFFYNDELLLLCDPDYDNTTMTDEDVIDIVPAYK